MDKKTCENAVLLLQLQLQHQTTIDHLSSFIQFFPFVGLLY